jgi:hypothetical protein
VKCVAETPKERKKIMCSFCPFDFGKNVSFFPLTALLGRRLRFVGKKVILKSVKVIG